MMKSPDSHSGTIGWGLLTAGIIAWDILAKETLSTAYDRFVASHKVLALGTVAVVGAHLAGAPEPVDIIHQVSKRTTKFAERYL